MAEITAALVKELREKTGAGMMDCKSALNETQGDIEAAVDWLRKKGLAKAAKKSGRVAAEGLIGVALSGTSGVVVEVNSETDFVARNVQFQTLVSRIAEVTLNVGTDVETIKNAPYPDGGSVGDAIAHAVATIGENLTLRRAELLKVDSGVVGSYLHNSVADGLGKIGVIVALTSSGNAPDLLSLARQIAMHVAAINPVAIDAAGVPADVIARERAILADKNAGKPANVLDKIIESGLKSYFKDVCLLQQSFIHEPAKTVGQVVLEAAARVGGPVTVSGFVRYALGEGIEKQDTDFAAEVAAAVNG